MLVINEQQLKKEITRQHVKQYTNTSFYSINTFKDVLKLAFKCKNKHTIDIILNNWSELTNDEINWGKTTKMIDSNEEHLVKSLHPKELLMIINIGSIMQKTYKMKPEVAFIFAFGIIHAHFVFENTSMDISIENMYNTLPNKYKSKSGEKKFKKDFFLKGTSQEIRKILYKTSKDGC
jgi:hypothetical protein|tara:strand:+ start:318 stop:851 length:534 start_codon:yes stop_codon:yes gene_type:complete